MLMGFPPARGTAMTARWQFSWNCPCLWQRQSPLLRDDDVRPATRPGSSQCTPSSNRRTLPYKEQTGEEHIGVLRLFPRERGILSPW